MPFGVSQDFLTLAQSGKRRALTVQPALFCLVLLGGIAAELLDPDRLGPFVVLYGAALVAGLIVGVLLGLLETRSWGESLKASWQGWMHAAVGAGTMNEVAHRQEAVRITPGRATGALLAAMNAACMIASWFVLPPFTLSEPYGILATVTVSATALVLGGLCTLRLTEGWWCHDIESQTLELVRAGRVGVWGVR